MALLEMNGSVRASEKRKKNRLITMGEEPGGAVS